MPADNTEKDLRCEVVWPTTLPELLVVQLECSERISQPFRLRLELVSKKSDVSFSSMIGKEIGLSAERGGGKRFFHGIVERFAQTQIGDELSAYTAEVVPWLALLDRRSDSRIFQNLSVPDIVKQVVTDAGYSAALELKVRKTYPPLEYCVQYRETDFAFVSRLLEEEGIAYWFRQEKDKHVMVLADDTSGHPALQGVSGDLSLGLLLQEDDADKPLAWIDQWHAEHQLRSGKWTVKDFDFKNPASPLQEEQVSGAAKLARFEYPARHADATRASARARLRIEIEEALACQHTGSSTSIDFVAGGRFKLEKHPRGEFNGEYLLTSVTHRLKQSLKQESGTYQNSFAALPAGTPFRAPMASPRPVVHGVQTAIVTGPQAEEIYVDEHGRAKVKFHWDRAGKQDENSSCWVRVAQTHASGGFGGAFWPRVGDEVVVSFEEGDPDRPLITGRVYNGTNTPPYALPAQMTKSALKTRSTKKGSSQTFNEIRFEDKKGEEHLFLHAEKDRHERTKNDLYELVEGAHHVKIVKDEFAELGAKRHTKVTGEVVESFADAHEIEVGKDRKEKIGMNLHTSVGMNRHAKVGQNEALDAGMAIHLKAGMNVVIEAGMQITLKAGAGFITIGLDGVSISGPMVKINSGGAAGAGSGAQPQAPRKPSPPKDGLKE